ncbi:hypothetical protein ACHAXR_012330 [Thalassiosira sp. AJA248-18]
MAASLHPLTLPSIIPRSINGNNDDEHNDEEDNNNVDTSIRGWDHSIIADLPNDITNANDDHQRHLRRSTAADAAVAASSSSSSIANIKPRAATFHAVANGHVVVGTSSSLSLPTNNTNSSNTNSNSSNTTNSNITNSNITASWQTSLSSNIVTVASNSDGSVIAEMGMLGMDDDGVGRMSNNSNNNKLGGPFLLAACSSNNNDNNNDNNNGNNISGTNNDTTNNSNVNSSMIVWINIINLTLAAKYTLPCNTSCIVSCAPVATCHDDASFSFSSLGCTVVAVAIACKTTGGKSEILVVQSIVTAPTAENENETNDERDLMMKKSNTESNNDDDDDDAMVLFRIDVDIGTTMNNNNHVEVCASPPPPTHYFANDNNNNNDDDDGKIMMGGAYIFRYLIRPTTTTTNSGNGGDNDGATTKCWEFHANEQTQLGFLHTLLAHDRDFTRAHSLADQIQMAKYPPSSYSNSSSVDNDHHDDNNRITTPLTKSYISLIQFRHILSSKDVAAEENRGEAKECLRRLTSNAITSGEVQCMVDAAEFIMGWPMNRSKCSGCDDDDDDDTVSSIQQVIVALSAVSTAIQSVMDVIGSSSSTKLSITKLDLPRKKLHDRIMALKALQSIIPTSFLLDGKHGTGITCNDPFLGVESIVGLLHLLVSNGAFKSVERLQSSDYAKKSPLLPHVDAIAASALRIPLTVHPQSFLPWLCDTIMPTLSMGDALLGSIRMWACKAADYYDEENVVGGIDSSILLISAVSKATARLTVAMNNCFTYPMQLLEHEHDQFNETQLVTPRNENAPSSSSSSSFCTSFDSKASIRSVRSARPTVLNIGMISGMKKKDGRMMSARRVNRSNSNNNTSLDFSFFNSPSSSSPNSTEASFIDQDDDDDEESVEHDCVEYKLTEALRLKKARELGMERTSLTLAHYSSKGEGYIVKELVKSVLHRTSSPEESIDNRAADVEGIVDEIRWYAVEIDADFDAAVQQYANELCDTNHSNIPQVLIQTQTLSQWCTSPSTKCQIVLKMLRLALVSVQRPPDLTSLAKEAICMAVEEEVKSELEEATRLLGIDGLVRRYCGNGAQEFFRVSDPSHGLKLVQHICRHIDSSTVLADALMLCDAFTHVSKLDTCVSLLQRTMVAKVPTTRQTNKGESTRAGQCACFMREIFSQERILAERVGERMAGYCAGTLEDCRKMILTETFVDEAKRQAVVASSTACAILFVMQDQGAVNGIRTGSSSVGFDATKLLKEFQKISKLQSGCDIFLTIEELRDPSSRASVVSDLLKPSVNLLLSRTRLLEEMEDDDSLRNELKPLVATAKQWCAILCDSPTKVSQLWSRAIGTAASHVAEKSNNHASLLLLEVSGLLDEQRNGQQSSFHSIMSVVLALFTRAFSEAHHLSSSMSALVSQDETDLSTSLIAMRSMAQASLLLREHILLYCPSCILSAALSLSNLTELVCEISTRSDMGVGERLERYIDMLQTASQCRRQSYTPLKKSVGMLADKRIPSSPNLHPTWYIGDGLLLQPLEALFLSMSYCKMILDIESTSSKPNREAVANLMQKSEIIHTLESRGAHTTSLRLLLFSTATFMSRSSSSPSSSSCLMFPNAEMILKKNNCVLAERSLGGTESGLTSGNIDVLMSVSFLLHLPKEMAFKIYQAALPSAIGKRDFSRILTLASIGAYCGVGSFSSGERFPWSKQRRFIEQCDELSCNAKWWKILSRYGVGFDPSVFSQSRDSQSSVEQTIQSYCEKLVWNASKKLGPRSTLVIARRLTEDYGLNKNLPPSSLIEFLLSAPDNATSREGTEKNSVDVQTANHVFDIRHDLNQTETAVRDCLALLPTLNQNVVIRKCVMNLERDERCAKDYDRHTMVLQLYRECLNKLSGLMKKSDARAKAHEEETGRIERRQDALVVISSIFDKYPLGKRPEYINMFERLPRDPSHPNQDSNKFSVLGTAEDVFDPLSPLDGVLEDENGSNSIVAALAPLCSLLQLPSGYLHARSLVVRFNKLKASGGLLPPFDSSVVPVGKKLKTCGDRADLAWWCSLQYDAGSVEQLKCLDMAHANATEASDEAESSKDPEAEREALERVKRIDAARAGLSDKILVDEVLNRHESTTKLVKVLYKSIIEKVQQRAQSEENYAPEHLVQALLVEGSLTAAVASLDDADGFSTHHFRLLALLVHDACKSLSNRYSHVNVGKCARLLTRQWLVHGDDLVDGFAAELRESSIDEAKENENEEQTGTKVKFDDDGEDTSEFVMDIGIISSSGDRNWSNDSKRNGSSGPGITSSEEPSALKSLSSLRESSDHLCSRVTLRIAFLICFAEDYHNHTAPPERGDENVDSNVLTKKQKMIPRSKLAQKSRQKTNCFEGDLALQHARELLLGIVFARQGSTISSTYGFIFDESSAYDDSILSSVPENVTKDEYQNKSKALSFAMRHRALRVATILCPQEVIARVVVEETYSADVDDAHLNKCAFGSFVAMEIEAMGLPLPHSDLVQLSVMHFPSYARTIWRNHGGSPSHRGFSGRLHLLLLELCVNDNDTVDWELFVLIFSELKRLELPRSLLLACECAVQSRAIALAASQNRLDALQNIEDATKKIAELIVSEVETNLGVGIEFDASECASTLHRLVSVIISLESIHHSDPTCFVQIFSNLSSQCEGQGQQAISDVFIKAAIRITDHLTDPESFCKTSSIIALTATDHKDTPHERIRYDRNDRLHHSTKSVCSEAIQNYESSFH